MGPINYTQGFKSPVDYAIAERDKRQQQSNADRSFGLQDRQLNMQQARVDAGQQLIEQKKADAMAMQKELADFSAIPNKTAKDYSEMILKRPELREDLKASYDLLGEEGQKAISTEAAQIYSAYAAGQPDIAKQIMTDRMNAAKNSGNDEQYQSMKAMIAISDANPDAAMTTAGLYLASVGGDKFASTMSSLEDAAHKRALRPGDLKKQNADLKLAGAKLNLTEADINRTIMTTKKLGVDTRKAIMEVDALAKGEVGGSIKPEKKFDMEQKLRKEYNSETGVFVDLQDAYRKINAAEATAAGDISLIISYMKMLDPGSVVREGEFATAQNAAGAPDRFRNTYNKIISGERLTASQRKEFRSQSEKLLSAAKKREGEVRNGLAPTIKRYGLSEDNVFYTNAPSEETAAASPAYRYNAETGELEAVGG